GPATSSHSCSRPISSAANATPARGDRDDEFRALLESVPSMASLQELIDAAVGDGTVPGAAALVARGDELELAAAGELAADSIVRIASITKPITAAAVMLLVDEGRLA